MRRTLVGAVLVALCCLAQHAAAATTAPFIVGTYYEQNGTFTCLPPSGSSGVSMCQVLFAAPPAGKAIRVTGVSCRLVALFSRVRDVYLAVNQNGNVGRQQALKAIDLRNAPRSGFYLVNEVVHDYLVSGPPRVVMDTGYPGTELTMDCQIAGTLQPA